MGRIEGHTKRAADWEADVGGLLDFSPITLASGQRIIRASGMNTDAVTGWMYVGGYMTGTGAQYATYFQPQSTGTAKILGHGMTLLIESGAVTNTAECGQFHILIYSGATISSRSADPTAGIHNVWAKIGSGGGSTWASGSRGAPIWSDIQINEQDVSAEEIFHFLATAGGSRARALIRMEDQIAVRFLESDGAIGEGFYATSGFAHPNAAGAQAWLRVVVGSTHYGLPLMATA